MKKFILILLIFIPFLAFSQGIRWAKDGNAYYRIESGEIIQYSLPTNSKSVLVSQADLTPAGQSKSLTIRNFFFSEDQHQLLIYTNTKKVWRLDTRGDYWILNVTSKALKKLGNGLAASSLMFAKFSPDGTHVGYVSQQNLYVENVASGEIKALTTDGTRKVINGTFDWVYEEEFS